MNTFDQCNGITYTIKPGDTLYKLSGRFRVPISIILRANPYLDVYNIQVGSRICIPGFAGRPPHRGMIAYTVREGDTIADILRQYGIGRDTFFQYNKLNMMHLQPGTIIQLPGRQMQTDEMETEPDDLD